MSARHWFQHSIPLLYLGLARDCFERKCVMGHPEGDTIGRSLVHPRSRRGILRGLGRGGVAAFLLGRARGRAARQEGTEIGGARPGGSAWEAVGRIEQHGSDFTAYGYLTYVAGLAEEQLYLEGGSPLARTEATARFTFFGNATLTSRSVLENLFVVNAEGEQTFYFSEQAGARFDRPESFFSGDE